MKIKFTLVLLLINFILIVSCISRKDIVLSSSNKHINKNLRVKWTKIPAGEFKMGSNHGNSDESPVHAVFLDEYFISKYEITHTQYLHFLNDIKANPNGTYNGQKMIDMDDSDCALGYNKEFIFKANKYALTPDTPVIEVTWYGAKEFCHWLSKKTNSEISLPTEAQWEKACKPGKTAKRYGDIGKISWYSGNSEERIHPVGQKKANSYGLYDMLGNVCEWCYDFYDKKFYLKKSSKNPNGPQKGYNKVVRGGSWKGVSSSLRSSCRSYANPSSSFYNLGFRVIKQKSN